MQGTEYFMCYVKKDVVSLSENEISTIKQVEASVICIVL
jgi:hypothetical protein